MIRRDTVDRVALIRIDRHERRNALDVEHLDALHDELEGAVAEGARAVVVTGEGSAFCSGADLDGVYGDTFRESLYRTLGLIRRVPVPVIAAVNGAAIGAGAQLAIACDLRVVAEGARFAVPTARNGLAVDPWTVRRLALLAGGGAARSMLLGAATLSFDQAAAAGLVDRSGSLDDAVAWAQDIATMAPLSLAYSKRALDVLFEEDGDGPAELVRLFDGCWASDDVAESGRARAEGRPPRFQGT
jgi:enoyl-CoA hydratase